jgi:MinD-like ATPase involved in chromosome partitioning or flagellar assembly
MLPAEVSVVEDRESMAGPVASEPGGIFISYRRRQAKHLAGRLYDKLAGEFGDRQVFMDVDALNAGVNFPDAIKAAIEACDVLLAIIGPDWVTEADEAGTRRLDDPGDFVRLEVEAALTRGVWVIPVLADEAPMPRPDELPESLAALTRRQAIVVRHETFGQNTLELVTAIRRALAFRREAEEQARRQAEEKARRESEERARREAEEEARRKIEERASSPGESNRRIWAAPARPSSTQGRWQRVVSWLTAGRFGSSASQVAERDLIARAKALVVGCPSIAVISRKGGIGKTTTTLMLGHTFASLRGDRVVALDGSPDADSLGYRVSRQTAATLTNLVADEHEIIRYADIRAYTNQAPSGLEILASDNDPRITTALGKEEYRRAIALLERYYNLILINTGTGVLESATKGILQLADQIVVVMSPSMDSARVAASTLDWLNENGHSELVRNAVAVINAVRDEGLVEVGKIEDHFQERCRAVVQVPWDPHLSAGAEIQLDRLRPRTQYAYLRVAAAIVERLAG